ncbi:hypothetical protein C0J52_27411 [Blattella germanica]|nr:hypothetical protein C0J52_27411 [Blattella germanica]
MQEAKQKQKTESNMATTLTISLDKMSPRKPQLLHMKSFSPEPGNSCPGTPRSASSTWLERRQSLLQSITQHEFSPVYNPVHPIDFIFKLVQLMVTIVCTGAYSEGVYQVTTSTTAQMMPYFVCSAYLIISSVILIGYVLGHSMPDLIIRIFNTLAGMLFLAAGLFALQNWRNQIALESDKTSELEDKEKVFLLATGLLCLVNTVLYLADVGFCSNFVTMASLPSTPVETLPPRKPRVPLLHMKSFSPEPGNSCPGTPRSAASTWLERRQSLLQSITQTNFSPVYDPVHPVDFIFKLVQLMVTIVCTGAYSEGVYQVSIESSTAQMMPYFLCSAYLIISSVILIGYVLGHSMPDPIVSIYMPNLDVNTLFKKFYF